MQVSIPPTIQALVKTIEAMPDGQSAEDALAAAKRTFTAFNKLSPEAKAGYLLRIRQEKEAMEREFDEHRAKLKAEYDQQPTPELGAELTHVSAQCGDTECAVDHSTSAKAAPNNLLAAHMSGLAAIHKMVEGNKTDFNAQGLAALASNDYKKALEWFELAVEFDPDHAEYTNNLSLACSYQGQFGRAAKLAMRALRLNSKLAPNNLILATAGMRAAIEACK